MKIGLLITSIGAGVSQVLHCFAAQPRGADEAVISHQSFIPEHQPIRAEMPTKVVYTHMQGRGLSRNRNNAIRHATADVLLICDDDVDLVTGFAETIRDAYERYPDADVITFQTLAPDGGPRKHYGKRARRHDIISICSVSSIEITFRRKAVEAAWVQFDEDFGLGSKHPVGEEVVFLKDCLDRGLRVLYYPAPITVHPRESSGARGASWRDGRAVFVRMFGSLGVPFFVLSRSKLWLAKTMQRCVRGLRKSKG